MSCMRTKKLDSFPASFYWDNPSWDFSQKIRAPLIIEGGRRHRHIIKKRFNSFRLAPDPVRARERIIQTEVHL